MRAFNAVEGRYLFDEVLQIYKKYSIIDKLIFEVTSTNSPSFSVEFMRFFDELLEIRKLREFSENRIIDTSNLYDLLEKPVYYHKNIAG